MTIRVYAVVCANGEIHDDVRRRFCVVATKDEAWSAVGSLRSRSSCGPHGVAPLRVASPKRANRRHRHRFLTDEEGAIHPCRCGQPCPNPFERKNRFGETITIRRDGRCSDCGEWPEACSPDDHK